MCLYHHFLQNQIFCKRDAEANECVASGGRCRHTNEVKKQGVLRPLQGKQDDYVSEESPLQKFSLPKKSTSSLFTITYYLADG